MERNVSDQEVLNAEEFLKKAVEVFKAMKPFNDFLNRALKDFKMPAR